jgi:hypothetical protein
MSEQVWQVQNKSEFESVKDFENIYFEMILTAPF